MSFEESVEKRLQEYELKIKKHLFQEKLDRALTKGLYVILGLIGIGLFIYFNKH
jgi:hypothetical protein